MRLGEAAHKNGVLQHIWRGECCHARLIFHWFACSNIRKIGEKKDLTAFLSIASQYPMNGVQLVWRIGKGGGIIGHGQVDETNIRRFLEKLIDLFFSELKAMFRQR